MSTYIIFVFVYAFFLGITLIAFIYTLLIRFTGGQGKFSANFHRIAWSLIVESTAGMIVILLTRSQTADILFLLAIGILAAGGLILNKKLT